jgi:hypothetical protein
MALSVRFSSSLDGSIVGEPFDYRQQSKRQFINEFLPRKYRYAVQDGNEPADIFICTPESSDHRRGEISVCLAGQGQNVPVRGVSITIHTGILYYFQHQNMVTRYLACPPAIALRCARFREQNLLGETRPCSEKEFAFVASRGALAEDEKEFVQKLVGEGNVKFMTQGEFDHLRPSPGYGSWELHKAMSRFKFVILFGSDDSPDSAAAKILTVFRARSVPVYLGCADVSRFISDGSFISGRKTHHQSVINRMKILTASERLYSAVVGAPKLNTDMHAYQLGDYLDPFLPPPKQVCEFDGGKPGMKTDSGWL